MARTLIVLLLISVIGYVQTSSAQTVRVSRWDSGGSLFSEVTGTVVNETDRGVHNISIAFTFRDLQSRVLGTERVFGGSVVGEPSVIDGETYFSFSVQ